MCMQKTPGLDSPRALYLGPDAHWEGNGFLEEGDFAAPRIEWLTDGDARNSIVRFGYDTPRPLSIQTGRG